MPKEQQEQALDRLSNVNAQISRIISTVVSGSKSIASQPSAVVSGVLGGFGGLSAAYLITSFVAALSFPIFGPLLTGLGIAAGVLTFRGSTALGVENEAAQRQIAHEENDRIAKTILIRIQKLPRSAPPQIRAELWNDYRIVSRELVGLASPPTKTPLLEKRGRPSITQEAAADALGANGEIPRERAAE
jgi:hypothetical protein